MRAKRGRPSGPLTRNGGTWTEAKFSSFIKNQLRSATRKWAPIQQCKKDANVERGFYLCAGCKEHVPPTIKQGRRKVTNIFVDHIEPIVDPATGFVDWDTYINRMFCEKDNLQLLCGECHDKKSMAERALTAKYNQERKENNE